MRPKKHSPFFYLGIVLGSLLGLVVVLLGTSIGIARTHWGQHKLLALALPAVNKALLGRLEVGEVESDLLHCLVLRDIALYDSEQELVARVGRAEIHYSLLALLHRNVHLTMVHVHDAHLRARYLRDGRLNLASLTKPTPPGGPLPVTISAPEILVELGATFEPQPGMAVQAARANLYLEAAVQVVDPRFRFEVHALKVHAEEPLVAELEAQGGAYVVTGDKLQGEAHNLSILVRATGEQLNKLAPAAELRGDWAVSLAVNGPLHALGIRGAVRPPRGLLELRATVGVLDAALPWELQLDGKGLDPGAARVGVPAALIDLGVAGRGHGPTGRVELHQLALKTTGGTLRAQGFAQGDARQPLGYPLPNGIAAELALDLDAPDLAALTRPFAPRSLKLGGAARARLKAAVAGGQLRVDADVQGQRLWADGNSVEELALAVHSQDLTGQVTLHARTLRTPLRLALLDLTAAMNTRALAVRAQGRDQQNLVFALRVDGQPKLRGQQLVRLDADLKELWLRRAGQQLTLRAPVHIAVDTEPPVGPVIDVGRLGLRLGEQQLTLAGHFEVKSQRFRASLDARGIDARRWAQLAAVTGVPQTAFTVHAQAAGTPRAPEGRLQLDGSAAAMPAQRLPASQLHADVTLHDQRARGELALQFGQPAQLARPHATVRFDAPLSPAGAVAVELNAQSQVEPWRELLPAAARKLTGLLSLRASLRGTLQHPELSTTLLAPQWQLEPLRGRSTTLALKYEQEQLSVGLDSELTPAKEAPPAVVSVKANTRVRLGVGPQMSAAAIKQEFLHAVLAVDASLSHLDLAKLVAALSPDEPPAVEAGLVDASLRVSGTPLLPTLGLTLTASGLAAGGFKNLTINTAVHYAGSELRANVNAGLPKQPLLAAQATTTLVAAQLLEGTLAPKKLPLRGTLAVLPLELSQVSPAKGSLTAHAELRGTVGAPEVTAWVRSDKVQFDKTLIGPLALDASLDGTRMLKAKLDAQQPGGSLKLSAQTLIPPRAETLQLELQAHNFQVNYEPRPNATALTDVVGMARGVLNAELKVKLARWGPSVVGYLKLENGGLMMKALQQPLRDVHVDVSVQQQGQSSRRSVVTLREVRLNADTGSAKVAGNVQLDGLKVTDLSLDAEARRFPVWASMIGLWVDSKLSARGHTEGDTLAIDVHMKEGGVKLPKIESARSVQPLGPFEDVKLVDQAALRAAARARAAQAKEERAQAASPNSGFVPAHLKVAVQLPEALTVSGPEVHAALTGRLDLKMDRGGPPRLTGQVRLAQSWSWVEILHHRYDIDHVQVSLSGAAPPNPLLNVEIARKLDEAAIHVMVNGTAAKPKITFRSDPPVYDQSQIIAIILTGENGSSKKDPQAVGMLSSLLIGQLRDQLAGRLPIDVMRVDVAGDDPMGVGQSSLEVGKYLRENLYLGYKRRFGSATTGMRRLNADEALIEYHFLSRYKLRTLYGDANVGALDLYWTKRF